MKEIIIGIVSGIVSGTGMGGGTILIFLLTFMCGIEQHIAHCDDNIESGCRIGNVSHRIYRIYTIGIIDNSAGEYVAYQQRNVSDIWHSQRYPH